MEHRNNIAKELTLYPDNRVYIVLNRYDGKVMVSVVKNAVAWIARQVQEIKNGTHKCGSFVDHIIIDSVWGESDDYHLLSLQRTAVCEDYVKRGYKVYSSKGSKLKIRYAIKQNKALLQVVNARNVVIGRMAFDTIPLAKAFASGKTMTQLVEEIKKNDTTRPTAVKR